MYIDHSLLKLMNWVHLNVAVKENIVLKNFKVIDRTNSTKMYSVQFGAKEEEHVDGVTIPLTLQTHVIEIKYKAIWKLLVICLCVTLWINMTHDCERHVTTLPYLYNVNLDNGYHYL